MDDSTVEKSHMKPVALKCKEAHGILLRKSLIFPLSNVRAREGKDFAPIIVLSPILHLNFLLKIINEDLSFRLF